MKISRIDIPDFHQFKNFSIDLTYPKGHEKEGQPLDKVCFIGQSGTGKTTILEGVKESLVEGLFAPYNPDNGIKEIMATYIEDSGDSQHYFSAFKGKNVIPRYWLEGKMMTSIEEPERALRQYLDDKENAKIISLPPYMVGEEYLDAEIRQNNNLFVTDGDLQKVEQALQEMANRLKGVHLIDEKNLKEAEFWAGLLANFHLYDQKATGTLQELLSNIEDQASAIEKLGTWNKENPNPRIELAEKCLDPILNHFNLKLARNWIKGGIKLLYKDGSEVPLSAASTGTRQILLTALPLYFLNTDNSIILIDEPETSLYPDIQYMLVNHYSSLAPNAQFFYATHSPIIASSFEPWEIIELKFQKEKNEDGKYCVEQELYYEGERHIDNYFLDPRYMRWDDILFRIFDLDAEGREEYRMPKLMEYAAMKKRIRKLDTNGELSDDKKKELLQEYFRLADLLGARKTL